MTAGPTVWNVSFHVALRAEIFASSHIEEDGPVMDFMINESCINNSIIKQISKFPYHVDRKQFRVLLILCWGNWKLGFLVVPR